MIYAAHGTVGARITYKKQYENFIGDQWVKYSPANYLDNYSNQIQFRHILGLKIAVLTNESASKLIEKRIKDNSPTRLAFANASLANMAFEDKQFSKVLQSFLLLNDGTGINIGSKFLCHKEFPANLNGTDFTPYFLDHCAVDLRIFLLGASPKVSSRAAEYFAKRWPKHQIVGSQHGFFSKNDEEEILGNIRRSQANLVLVAMGNGLQEYWVNKLVPDVVLSAWGIGALFDFLASEINRAPEWMRRMGIEWIYRLIHEPKRLWKRYLIGNAKFMFRLLMTRISAR